MKLRLSIILLAVAALAAAPAAGQTIKSLGYNTTNGQVVANTGTNVLTFTNDTVNILGISDENALVWDVQNNSFYTETSFFSALAFAGTNAITAAAETRTNLGLGATNAVTFSNITANGTLAVSNTATFSTNVTVAGSLTVGSFTTTTPSTWALDATQTAAATNGVLTLPSNANVLRITNANTISAISNGVLGAFYFLINQSGTNVVISNSATITARGATNMTLGANESATLITTTATNATAH